MRDGLHGELARLAAKEAERRASAYQDQKAAIARGRAARAQRQLVKGTEADPLIRAKRLIDRARRRHV